MPTASLLWTWAYIQHLRNLERSQFFPEPVCRFSCTISKQFYFFSKQMLLFFCNLLSCTMEAKRKWVSKSVDIDKPQWFFCITIQRGNLRWVTFVAASWKEHNTKKPTITTPVFTHATYFQLKNQKTKYLKGYITRTVYFSVICLYWSG